VLLAIASPVFAEEAASDSTTGGWSVFPAAYYTDETKLAGGAYAVYDFGDLGSGLSSTMATNLIYTQNNQVLSGVIADLSWERYRFLGLTFGLKFPDTFYGIGRDTPEDGAEDYTDRSFSFLAIPQRRVRPNLFAGPVVWFEAHSLTDLEPTGQLASGILPGTADDYKVFGLGGMVTWDTRDHNAYPTKGSYYEAWAIGFSESLGSDFEFSAFEIDLRQYVPLAERKTLAVQALLSGVTSGAPVLSYPALGDNNLRGFASRYADRALAVLHAGYRHRFANRWGFVVFAGVGDVAPTVSDLSLNQLEFGAGFGIRFMLIEDARLNLRLDFGFGTGGNSSSDFIPGEAF
jgi:outer membrane protein assembly factor BamA